MALAILDGTQTATTLSTILSSGQHITAHTVVSLGAQAITDMRSAVSGSVVSISNFPASQAISGTVTANVADLTQSIVNGIDSYAANANDPLPVSFTLPSIPAGAALIGQVSLSGTSPVIISTGTARIGVVTVGAGTVTIGAGTAQIGSVTASISNFPATQAISIASVTIGNSVTIASLPAISGTVTVGNTVTIAGTVTANPTGTQTIAGTVTASLSISSTAITSGSFASLTSATLVPGNVARKMATVFNQGAGQLFVNAGSSATTLGGGFMVALSSGDYFECGFTTTTLSAIFATAGTASWMSH